MSPITIIARQEGPYRIEGDDVAQASTQAVAPAATSTPPGSAGSERR